MSIFWWIWGIILFLFAMALIQVWLPVMLGILIYGLLSTISIISYPFRLIYGIIFKKQIDLFIGG